MSASGESVHLRGASFGANFHTLTMERLIFRFSSPEADGQRTATFSRSALRPNQSFPTRLIKARSGMSA